MPDFPLQKQLAELKAALDADPTNVEAAERYWAALGSFAGNDIRSGGFLVETFRGCALASKQGIIAFARAYQELFAKTGEKPKAQLFDENLARTLKARLPELSETERGPVDWILASLK
jgi:hypothetical protein